MFSDVCAWLAEGRAMAESTCGKAAGGRPVTRDIWSELSPPYATIVADPPWHYEGRVGQWDDRRMPSSRDMPYSTMTVEEIKRLPLADIAVPGAHVYLWTTQRYVWDARDVMESWGCPARKLLTWCKPPMGSSGLGGSFANTTEFVLFGRKTIGAYIAQARAEAGISQSELALRVQGRKTRLTERWENDGCFPTDEDWDSLREALPGLAGLPDLAPHPERSPTTWWEWPRGAHSEKPAAFMDVVEAVSPGPYVELFCRQPRFGWDTWGYGYEEAS